jgi:adhesin/invasin
MIARAFRASWRGRAAASFALVVGMTSCTRVPLTAPTKSTIALFTSAPPVPDGSINVIATVTEEAGTPVQNGTLVSFTTTLGHLDPTSARTTNGQASVKFFSDGLSGTATISAFSGGATSAGTGGNAGGAAATVQIALGGAAADNVIVHAEPSSVPLSGGTAKIVAQVRDAAGNGLPNVLVVFSTTAGSLQPPSVTTDANGTATTNLTTTSKATVTASAGAKSATVDVNVAALPTISIQAAPASPVAGQPVTFTIGVDATNAANPVRNVRIDYGDGDFEDLGAVTGSTTASHVYDSDGNRSVTVTVTDTAGQQTRQVLSIVVSPSVPVNVTITVAPPSPVANAPVDFTATVAGSTAAIESYDWDFGDNTQRTTTGNQTSKVYAAAGTYTVKVTVHASDGSTGVGAADIRVN